MTQKNEGGGLTHAVNKTMDMVGGMAGKAGATMTTTAVGFVQSAGISDKYECMAGEIALERATAPTVCEVAQKMIDDHTESTTKLKRAVVESAKVTSNELPADLDTRRSQMIRHLREVPDDKFETTYIDQQVLAHEEAVKLMHTYRDDGDCPVLRRFASETSPIIEGHLDRVKRLEKA